MRKKDIFQINLTLWCDAHREIKLPSVHHPAESSSAVCITPWNQAPWCEEYFFLLAEPKILTLQCRVDFFQIL